MLAKVGLLALIPVVLILGLALTTDTAFVDVKTDDVHLFVPVPMIVAQVALNFVPEDETEITCPELWRYREPIARVIDELRRGPDGELVSVRDGDTFVLITKEGSNLHVQVETDDGDTQVDVRVPLSAAKKFLARLDGPTFSAKDLLASVNNTINGQVAHVVAEDAEVKVWVW